MNFNSPITNGAGKLLSGITYFLKHSLRITHPEYIIIPVVIVLIAGYGTLVYWLLFSGRKKARQKYNLQRNQRTTLLWRQWLNPVIEFIVVGSVIWTDLEHGLLQWLLFLLGVLIGLPLGALRGRFSYVSSIGKARIILERSVAEIIILVVLVVIKLIERTVTGNSSSPLSLLVITLLGIGIASSVGRMTYITIKHYKKAFIEDL